MDRAEFSLRFQDLADETQEKRVVLDRLLQVWEDSHDEGVLEDALMQVYKDRFIARRLTRRVVEEFRVDHHVHAENAEANAAEAENDEADAAEAQDQKPDLSNTRLINHDEKKIVFRYLVKQDLVEDINNIGVYKKIINSGLVQRSPLGLLKYVQKVVIRDQLHDIDLAEGEIEYFRTMYEECKRSYRAHSR